MYTLKESMGIDEVKDMWKNLKREERSKLHQGQKIDQSKHGYDVVYLSPKEVTRPITVAKLLQGSSQTFNDAHDRLAMNTTTRETRLFIVECDC